MNYSLKLHKTSELRMTATSFTNYNGRSNRGFILRNNTRGVIMNDRHRFPRVLSFREAFPFNQSMRDTIDFTYVKERFDLKSFIIKSFLELDGFGNIERVMRRETNSFSMNFKGSFR